MGRNLFTYLFAVLCCIALPVAVKADNGSVFTIFDASKGLADNSAQVIKCTKTGRMVIATIGKLNFYDGAAFTHIDPTDDDTFPLPKYTGHYRLAFDRHHHLWVKNKRLVTCVDLMTERFVSDVQAEIKKIGMEKPVDDLFSDNNSNLWFLSGNQLYCIELEKTIPVGQQSELHDVDVYDHRIQLQFFANGVVSAFDLESGRHLYDAASYQEEDTLRHTESSVTFSSDSLFYQIRNGSKDATLWCFDVVHRQWRKLMHTPYHLNNMALLDNNLYIASEYGYWIYDTQTGATTHVETLQLDGGRPLQTDVNAIAFDRQGGMWLGTEKRAVLYSRPYASPFHVYTFDEAPAKRLLSLINASKPKDEQLPRHVNCRIKDSRGWVWSGSYTDLRLLKSNKEEYVFTCKDGLLNEMIHSIIEDDNHDIWASTSFGISHVFIRNNNVWKIVSYYGHDGIPEESFVKGQAIKLADGTIVMQSLDHIVTFNPAQFHYQQTDSMILYPKLVKLEVNGRDIQPGTKVDDRVILDCAITRAREVAVNYNQNSLTLVFSGLNYFRPLQTYYRVRVKGIYNEWRVLSHANSNGLVDAKGLLHLHLVGIRPGKYAVELQASTTPDVWLQKPFVWTIRVEQPWWRSTGVYLLLGLVLLLIAAGNVYYFNRNTRLRMRYLNDEKETMKLVRSFVRRCHSLMELEAQAGADKQKEENNADELLKGSGISKEFANIVETIMPLVLHESSHQHLTLHDLADKAHIDFTHFCRLISENIYKSPQSLAAYLQHRIS